MVQRVGTVVHRQTVLSFGRVINASVKDLILRAQKVCVMTVTEPMSVGQNAHLAQLLTVENTSR